MKTKDSSQLKILIIRIEKIGDMVCSTPSFEGLRNRFPTARICVLANEYNYPVVKNNPHIDKIYIYQYTKHLHRNKQGRILPSYLNRLKLVLAMRAEKFDYAITLNERDHNTSVRFANLIGAKKIISCTAKDGKHKHRIDIPMPPLDHLLEHQALRSFRMLRPLGLELDTCPSHFTLVPDPEWARDARKSLPKNGGTTMVGIHISAREISRRWPHEKFCQLIKQLAADKNLEFAIFWSPGEETSPLHPGDDSNAEALIKNLSGYPIHPFPTSDLGNLIGGIACCDYIICIDSGILHLAAALRKPIIGLFENLKHKYLCWYPWGVPNRVVFGPNPAVASIEVDAVAKAFFELKQELSNNDKHNNA